MKILYFGRLFCRTINIDVNGIKRIQFSMDSSGKNYPNVAFIIKQFPFYLEIRLDKDDDILAVIKILSKQGSFKIKPMTDRDIMKKRIAETIGDSKCVVY